MKSFRRVCIDFLDYLELPISRWDRSMSYHMVLGRAGYVHVNSRERMLPESVYLARAIAILLDLGCISFCRGHLGQFDTRYFAEPTGRYRVSIDGDAEYFQLTQRQVDCLDGFSRGLPVWVLSRHERDRGRVEEGRMHISSTLQAFAITWGSVWQYFSESIQDATAWFIVNPGFLVPGVQLGNEPQALQDEILSLDR
ncbi:hypothetical protein BCR34DRAFT_565740 [Clohesyomyces aquaticus]|uniref:Uncharacterized protein n=1 Tax=Clohesyomyces aquaticus TaxID=1231657 RepID=A0A1Y1ZM97_9PLEO|nr:hypothetical protein BCR34DRAFT_565740 [Clohesyomyces aquaticus]